MLVCGGRDFADRERVYALLDIIHSADAITMVIHGCARGADSLASDWGRSRGIRGVIGYQADWQKHGKAAGAIRNARMLAEGKPGLVVAFPGGRGTADMVRRARAAGVETMVFE